MRSRIRFGLIVSSIVFMLLGVGAFLWLAVKSADQVNSSFGSQNIDPTTGDIIGSTTNIVHDTVILTTLLPAAGVVFILVGALCAAGAIASFVATDAVDRAARHRAPATPTYDAAHDLSAPETLQHG
jgi:hypothetical protein